MSKNPEALKFAEAEASDVTSTRVVVAVDDNQGFPIIVGLATVDTGTMTLESVRVLDNWRRLGVGSRLVLAAEAMAGGRLGDTGILSREGRALLRSMGRKTKRGKTIDGRPVGAMLMAVLLNKQMNGELQLHPLSGIAVAPAS